MAQPQKKLIKLSDIVAEYSIPKSTIYHLIKNDSFPRQIALSKRSVVWKRSEVEAWIDERQAMGAS